jgi:predicted nucleic acid-binding protein
MTRFVIDPLALLQLASGTGDAVNSTHRLVAPNAIRSQALNLLLQRMRAGVISEQEALDVHEKITQLKMRLLGDRVSRRTAWQLARQHNWITIFEAEYIAVTKLQADALVTIDADLAAKASGIVPLAPLSDLFAD